MLFVDANTRRHPKLFLPRLLAEEAEKPMLRGTDEDRARQVLLRWADMADQGHLSQKETTLDADFLQMIFGEALGYRSVTENPHEYHRQKQFTVSGAGTADGALGQFSTTTNTPPIAIIELKGADTDLDHDKFNGRTPAQQCWDYLNQLPDTPWGIVSNYVTIRLYHRDSPARAYEEFTVTDWRDEARFRQFYYLFERNGLLGNKLQAPRALSLLKRTQTRQREVGNELYEDYSAQRLALIEHLIAAHDKTQDEAIHIAQKILDRIIFVAFCEDRALLPPRLIHRAYSELPAFSKVTNPRWQNFKTVFGFIDRGDEAHGISRFNGNLFKPDSSVDNLELDDQWTHFFSKVGGYDFRDEVNVDVLGHLFERSVTELEKLRVVGLFGKQTGENPGAPPFMPTSAQRKRFGIYYTPPQFTRLIVENTLGVLIAQRVEPLPDLSARAAELRKLKVCDPACGSGAFLIAAYEKLEEAYEEIVRAMRLAGDPELIKQADALERQFPDYILSDNLHGVDLSAESVEITQLALWIRSARKGRTLTDLSSNIVCGNSLISDAATHPRAFIWAKQFPGVFNRSEGGFDVVIGNPPWERIKQQKREFFAFVPELLAESNPEKARKLIGTFEHARPELFGRWTTALTAAAKYSKYFRTCGTYPLSGRGDLNMYPLFAELARKIVSSYGRIGMLVPSGIATDTTTKEFFADLMKSRCLIALYDFENRKFFPDVDGRSKFSVLLIGGSEVKSESADFVFFAQELEELQQKARHIRLNEKDLKLLNPNTHTCAIFRSQDDAELTKRIYRTSPVLIDRTRRSGNNPWAIKFRTMFHQSADAKVFHEAEELKKQGYQLIDNIWTKERHRFLPCYEAKMFQQFDHRAASVITETTNFLRQGQRAITSLVEHQNPEFTSLPRWWVDESLVEIALADYPAQIPLAFKNVTSATNQRTMIATFLPRVGIVHSAPFIFTNSLFWPRKTCCLLANLNTFVYDYVARQKVGGNNFSYFIVEQLPTLPPERYDDKCPWKRSITLEEWISERALKLTCTSEDMIPLAEAAGFEPRIWRWKEEERAKLRAELDAAYFILYGIKRADIEYILGTFQGVAKEDQVHGGSGPTRQLILEAHEKLFA